jgi:hypothetical protein
MKKLIGLFILLVILVSCDTGTKRQIILLQGTPGVAGIAGENGQDGQDGEQGIPGQDGEDGQDGEAGRSLYVLDGYFVELGYFLQQSSTTISIIKANGYSWTLNNNGSWTTPEMKWQTTACTGQAYMYLPSVTSLNKIWGKHIWWCSYNNKFYTPMSQDSDGYAIMQSNHVSSASVSNGTCGSYGGVYLYANLIPLKEITREEVGIYTAIQGPLQIIQK